MKTYRIEITCRDRRTKEEWTVEMFVKYDNPGFVARALIHEMESEDERNDEHITYKCTKIEEQ